MVLLWEFFWTKVMNTLNYFLCWNLLYGQFVKQLRQVLRDDSPWDGEGFRLKNIRIRGTVSRKIACIVGMYTSDPSGQFYSLQYESSTYLRGW